jgi:hypothetical protein
MACRWQFGLAMTISKKLSLALVSVLPFGMLACSGGDKLGQKGQLITCQTDPGTGVILRCEPGGGGGGSNTCVDVDEDGDGEPHDSNTTPVPRTLVAPDDGGGSGSDMNDDDGDGIPNSEDCDTHPGEDDHAGADLPYDVRPALGSTTAPVKDAFASEGMQPAAILSVTGATWRAAELSAGTSFVVTQDDCDHAGNRDIGRDRVVVTWMNADGSTSADHLDIRYCD